MQFKDDIMRIAYHECDYRLRCRVLQLIGLYDSSPSFKDEIMQIVRDKQKSICVRGMALKLLGLSISSSEFKDYIMQTFKYKIMQI